MKIASKRDRAGGQWIRFTWESLAGLGRAIGKGVAKAYRSIDPDVGRHLVQLPLLSYSLLSSKEEVMVAGKPDGYRPVVFVHGLGGSRGDFLAMATHFWLNGRRRLYRIYFAPDQTIPAMSRSLSSFVRQVARLNREEQVDIVAHSLGGVVARLALVEGGLSRRVATLITLGSPHQGTHSARYANTRTIRDLRPGSRLLTRLAKRPWPRSVRGISFWSRNDLMIVPAESAIAPGTKPIEVTPFTHYSYLIDPDSWSAVQSQLQGSKSTGARAKSRHSRH
jgi:triacylglycerol esterase/lipase EstA (alpha/beta hydrolase family)